jgi:hypothetical protein
MAHPASQGRSSSWARALLALFVFASFLGASPRTSIAQDAASELSSSPDFRVRVSAAIMLGRTKPPGARQQLERALDDAHPAVRAAAAAALSSLGDPAAVPVLERKANGETSASVKAQMRTSIDALRARSAASSSGGGASMANAKYVLQLGAMRNNTPVRSEQIGTVMRTAAKSRAAGLPGAVVMDGTDPAILRQASEKKIPVLTLDGQLNRLQQTSTGNSVTFQAQVEFSVKKYPEQSLQGTLSGAATTTGDAKTLQNPSRVAELQYQAVDGAVESAMRNAARGLTTLAGQR